MTKRAEDIELTERTTPTFVVLALAVGCFVVLGAGLVLLWSGATTASARFSASTENESSFVNAAFVDLIVDGESDVAQSSLQFDASNMYPGLVIERCIEVTYRGDPTGAEIRLFGVPEPIGGALGELDQYVMTTVERGAGGGSDCTGFSPINRLFEGTLRQLWTTHGAFTEGLPISDSADDLWTARVRIALEVADDNRAQGLGFSFWLTLEARP